MSTSSVASGSARRTLRLIGVLSRGGAGATARVLRAWPDPGVPHLVHVNSWFTPLLWRPFRNGGVWAKSFAVTVSEYESAPAGFTRCNNLESRTRDRLSLVSRRSSLVARLSLDVPHLSVLCYTSPPTSTMDDTFDPASLTRVDSTPTLSTKNLPSAVKQSKSSSNYPRIDLEPIYTDLKDAIGHKWEIYFDAITRFTRGDLGASEFGDATDDILYSSDTILHLHNKFICAIAFNSTRDSPEPGVAAWVTAQTDKSAANAAPKTAVTSDAGEQRLKKEVMAIHARDRRRLKNINNDQDETAQKRNSYEDAYNASKYKLPEATNTNAPGLSLTKTNWEPEIKKRYQQPLFVESAEFPDAANVLARMVPICYEEAIPQGSSAACAEFVVTGAEFFLKDILNTIFERVRANGPSYEYLGNGHDGHFGGGIFTAKYRKQVTKEMDLVKAGLLQRTRDDDMVPAEYNASKTRRPLGVSDFKLADRVGPKLYSRVPLLGFELANNATETDYDDWKADRTQLNSVQTNGNGHTENGAKTDDEMDLDEDAFDWDDTDWGGRGALDSLLDDCLAMPA